MLQKGKIVKYLTACFFAVGILEVVSEYLQNKLLIISLKPLIPLLLIVIYFIESTHKNKLFVFVLLSSLITNILFIPKSTEYLQYALIAFTIHRILVVTMVLRLQKIKDYIPFCIATLPFLLVFFYLFMETAEIPQRSYALLLVQNILISIFSGLALSSYVMHDNKQNSVLLIAVLLFVMLQFIVFIEKYLLINEFTAIFRPLAMTFNVLAFFSLYKYVITAEQSNHN
ncbi:MAG: hypothetical protein ACK4IZ_06655 [Flavobacterium sp.]|uniref:hypothetical protein n=1 Tax=Flavobacterium sp. TaxID=239 RepID=UPI00391B554E